MMLRASVLSAAVLLSACAMKMPGALGTPETAEQPKKAQPQNETIHDLDAEPFAEEPAPLPPKKAKAPVVRAQPVPPPALMAPMAGRVGIMSLLGNELTHVHAGTFGGHRQDYNVQYDFNGYVVEELRKNLVSKTPYQPVMVQPTAALLKAGSSWQKTSGGAFAPVFQREFDGIIKQNRLSMLIVVSYATLGDGQLMSSRDLRGSGLYTRSFLGTTQAAVFSTLQFYRLVGEPARLVQPIAPEGERSVGDLPNAKLPEELDELPPRYLVPVYGPLRTIVQNKIAGLISLPRKLGH